MPELPEVETTRRGIAPFLEQQVIKSIVVRNPKFRVPVPENIDSLCSGKKVHDITRRAKYILIHLSEGYILIHLGMSGHLRIVPENTPYEKHDHISLVLADGLNLRFCDPRRFGLFLYLNTNPNQNPLLSHLGPEPLSEQFNGNYLYHRAKNKHKQIKALIMDNQIVVGVGNIYATESLFFAGIHPNTTASSLSVESIELLTYHIKQILAKAIACGGTTLRDFYAFDGKPGYFSMSLQVYGRKNQPCFQCHHPIETMVIAGRSSAFCSTCQI